MDRIGIFTLLLAAALLAYGPPAGVHSASFSVRTRRDVESENSQLKKDPMTKPANIKSLSVKSLIMSRFATTTVTSQIKNAAEVAREVVFDVQIPESAFIYNFSMVIDGEVYIGNVMEKEEAKVEYRVAKNRGQTAGIVHQTPRETNRFNVAVNVAAGNKVFFTLDYQELLLRKLGKYEHRISIQPGQAIPEFEIEVSVIEPQGITFIESSAPPPESSNRLSDQTSEESPTRGLQATISRTSSTRAHVTFAPSRDQQRSFSPTGINGEFTVRYDVNHDELSAGEIQIFNGYFVHYFAPADLPIVKKNVVFVIDTSGSMSGTKIRQTREAMSTILDDLRTFDNFNIITFSSSAGPWRRDNGLVPATPENVILAKDFAAELTAHGSTNFNDAVLMAVNSLRSSTDNSEYDEKSAHLIIVLTDGKPTAGETNTNAIRNNIREAIGSQYSLFCLGFGKDLDFNFLEKLSFDNDGIARKIYEDSDASLQLKGFYDEVATPLLFDVNMNYPNDLIDDNSLTQNVFPIYYNGSEIVIAGSFRDGVGPETVHFKVHATTGSDEIELEKDVSVEDSESDYANREVADNFLERLWAYLTIKQDLKKANVVADEDEAERLRRKALEMSLKYNFVSSLTSMIVVKPDDPHNSSFSVDKIEETVPRQEMRHSLQRKVAGHGNPGPSNSNPQYQKLPSSFHLSMPKLGPQFLSPLVVGSYGPPGFPGRAGPSGHAGPPGFPGPSGNSRPGSALPTTRGVSQSTSKYEEETTTTFPTTFPVSQSTTEDIKSNILLIGMPVYVLNFENENTTVTTCLKVHGKSQEFVNLLTDQNIGIRVNANLKKHSVHKYISDIVINISEEGGSRRGSVTINLMSILVVAQNNMTMSKGAMRQNWSNLLSRTGNPQVIGYLTDSWTLIYKPENEHLVLSNGQGISLLIGREKQSAESSLPSHNLQIWFEDKSGFSSEVKGLLGQFLHAQGTISDQHVSRNSVKATFEVDGDRQTSVRREDYWDARANTMAECWLSKGWLKDLIKGKYLDYLV